MNNKNTTALYLLLALATSQTAYAQGSTQNFSEAAGHSVKATGHSVAGSAKLAVSAVAAPLIIVGSIGAVSQSAGEDLWNIANQPIGDPLPISDETVSAGPAPDMAIKTTDPYEGEGI